MLSEGAKRKLLEIARTSIEEHLKKGVSPSFDVDEPELLKPAAAFVSLKKDQKLRGCIGFIEADEPLYQVVSSCAVSSATADPRFSPITLEELPHLQIEISVLSPFRRVMDPSEIEVGRHGLFISQGFRQGLLLPQVAQEMGWDRETFLSQTCVKAGLPPDAWRHGADVYLFTADIVREKSP